MRLSPFPVITFIVRTLILRQLCVTTVLEINKKKSQKIVKLKGLLKVCSINVNKVHEFL